jgi:ectoine hydroxylase-related dioxygenase (phytanoyl-CoA dioxygenase family)
LSPAFAKLALGERTVGATSSLYGERACLFKDKLIFKPPGAAGYALHQDYTSWDSFPESFVTVIVAIDPSSAQNGCHRNLSWLPQTRLHVAARWNVSRVE